MENINVDLITCDIGDVLMLEISGKRDPLLMNFNYNEVENCLNTVFSKFRCITVPSTILPEEYRDNFPNIPLGDLKSIGILSDYKQDKFFRDIVTELALNQCKNGNYLQIPGRLKQFGFLDPRVMIEEEKENHIGRIFDIKYLNGKRELETVEYEIVDDVEVKNKSYFPMRTLELELLTEKRKR